MRARIVGTVSQPVAGSAASHDTRGIMHARNMIAFGNLRTYISRVSLMAVTRLAADHQKSGGQRSH
jgi:hypothetical protein